MIFQMFWYISNIFVDSGKNYCKNKKQISIYSHFRHTFYKHLYSPLTLTLFLLIPAKMSLSMLVYMEQQKQQASDCFQSTAILAGKISSKQIVFSVTFCDFPRIMRLFLLFEAKKAPTKSVACFRSLGPFYTKLLTKKLPI